MIVEERIRKKLLDSFTPEVLDVVNESYQHNVPDGSESHFKVIVVSSEFDGQRLIQRHRAINKCLAYELANDIHALAIHVYTSDEWSKTEDVPLSPKCLGGSRVDRS